MEGSERYERGMGMADSLGALLVDDSVPCPEGRKIFRPYTPVQSPRWPDPWSLSLSKGRRELYPAPDLIRGEKASRSSA